MALSPPGCSALISSTPFAPACSARTTISRCSAGTTATKAAKADRKASTRALVSIINSTLRSIQEISVVGFDTATVSGGAGGVKLPASIAFLGMVCTCGRVTRGPVCSGCLDRLHIHQSFVAPPICAANVGAEGAAFALRAAQLCRGIGRPRLVALPRAVCGLLGRFLPYLAGGASRSAGLFGGPVASFIRVFLSKSFIAERKGTLKCLEKVAEHRTEIFAEVEAWAAP